MKLFKKSNILTALICCTLLLQPTSIVHANERLKFGIIDTPPFIIYTDGKLAHDRAGLSIELMKLLESKLNIQFDFYEIPWPRAKLMMKAGQLDGLTLASFSPERKQNGFSYPMLNGDLDVSRKVISLTYSLFTRRDSILEWDGKKLSNLRYAIGANKGYSIVKFLTERNIPVHEAFKTTSNLDLLLLNRLDGVAGIEMMIDSAIKREPNRYKDIEKNELPLINKPYFLPLSHSFVERNPLLAEQIWTQVSELAQSSVFQGIVEDYLENE